ncbi:MAG: ORF6C domain-containing protein [Ardenticatenaceae bacterium]|nr:ORF6C domain-containing protein [Ardenticatenaceae bacterium]
MSDNALQPMEQKTVLFYDDEITAVRLADGRVMIPVRPLCDRLGVAWSPQLRRINRDAVLADEVQGVTVTVTPGGKQEMMCLPLDYISGWLFGINADRVKSEIKDRLIRYQRECYKVLAEAFQDGRLTTDTDMDIEALLAQDSPAAQAYQMAMAVVRMARQQLLMEARLDTAVSTLAEHGTRLDQLEAAVGGEHITEAQAAQISQAVKAVALALGKRTKKNEFGGVYGELYRKFNVSSYKAIPQRRFDEVMAFLNEWLQSHISGDPF